MKNIYILFLLLYTGIFAQVTTTPVIPTQNDQITLHLNTTGTNLETYTGDIYAHTGVLTTESTSNSDWKHVKGTWGINNTQPKLTKTGTNTYTLSISPVLKAFYQMNISETVTHIAIVFRSSDGTEQTDPDIFIPIYTDGLNIAFTNPSQNDVFDLNQTITIAAESNITANLELKINNTSVQTTPNTKTITKSYTFTATGATTIKTIAVLAGETKESEISVYVKTPTQTATKPTGLLYGLNKNPDNSVTFLLQASQKSSAFVIGEFTNWKLNPAYQMFKDGDDYWLTISGLDVDTEYAYQYVVDYDLTIADPYSEKVLDPNNDQYIPNATYPNLKEYPTNLTTGIVSTFLINETYTWQSTSYSKPDKNNLVIYELLIRDFTVVNTDDIGDFKTAITKLDYLQNLGINAIELLPVNEFEGNDSWGYNPSFHGALDKAYGSKNDFKTFIDACHQRGIAVIVDVVYNHAYSQSPLAQMYWDSANFKPTANSPYLNPDATHPYNVGYDFNHENPYTKTYVKQTLAHWINEYKIDGFRFDLSKGFTQTNNPNNVGAWNQYDASRIAILQDYADYIWTNTVSDTYLILEHLSDNSEEVALANYGFMLWGNMSHSYNQNTMGWSSDAEISWIAHTSRGFNSPNVVGYMESHDEERLMYNNLQYGNSYNGYDIQDLNTALARQEIAGCFFLPIPGPKMIWQFGELGYDINIDFNGRTGRKPMHWDYFKDDNRKKIYDTWSKLAKLKTTRPEFNTSNFSLDTGGLVKRIHLMGATDDVIIIGNFDVATQSKDPGFSKNTVWYELFSNTSLTVTDANKNTAISLAPGEYKLYSTVNYQSSLPVSKVTPVNQTIQIYPNPTKALFSLNTEVTDLILIDATGKSVKQFQGTFQKEHLFNIEGLKPGIYYIKAQTSVGILTEKLIKT